MTSETEFHGPGNLQVVGGPANLLRPHEYDELPVRHDCHVQLFDLGVDAERAAYEKLLADVANKAAVFLGRPADPIWDAARSRYVVLCRWSVPYKVIPPSMVRRL